MNCPKSVFLLSLLGLCQVGAMAYCPTFLPNVIFCDDFDTYCATGGFPGDVPCATYDGEGLLRSVWYKTSAAEGGGLCGSDFKMEPSQVSIFLIPDPLLACRYPSKELAQHTVRDWRHSPPLNEPGQILDLHHFIGDVFGSQYTSVSASDSEPLILEYLIAADVEKIYVGSSFIELALGDYADNLNRANTDYAKWPKSPCCGGSVSGGPWPMICAQGNPDPAISPTSGCPSVATNPPPTHNAIAVGALAVLDTDPCHCGDSLHRPVNSHLSVFDGQLWWTLKAGSGPPGAIIDGVVSSLDLSAPMPPPADFPAGCTGGNFNWASPLSPNWTKAYNRVTLTIKTDTIKVELVSNIRASNGYVYQVYSRADNIQRKFTGPFDRMRLGVGPGCELNSSWTACKSGSVRSCLNTPDGSYVDFDNVILRGGYGYTVEGACCSSLDNSCGMTLQQNCVGRWTRSGLRCEDTGCCAQIYGDANDDGSVDMDDFAVLQTCITPVGGAMSSACRCFDYNGDNAVGGADIQHFAECANGPGVPGKSVAPCVGRGW